MMRCLVPLLAFCAIACGTTSISMKTRASLPQSDSTEAARTMAPDLYARAEKAYADAEIAKAKGSQAKADDLNKEGRLWLAAAVAESERLQIEEERLRLERAQDRSYTEANQEKAATDLRIQRRARERAAAIATQEADNALALADARADAKWDRASLRKAKTGLLNRADLNLSAAQALGATTSHINEARSLLAKLRKIRTLETRKAQQMLWRSESLLAEARARKAQPDPELATQLMKEAIVRKYQTESDEFGVAVWDKRSIDRGNVDRERVLRLSKMLAMYPHGSMYCTWVYSKKPPPPSRLARLKATLATDVERSIFLDAKKSIYDVETLRCVLPSYVVR